MKIFNFFLEENCPVSRAVVHALSQTVIITMVIWHYRFWSFKSRDEKLEGILPKNQHTQRKLLNFENWTNERGALIRSLKKSEFF